MATRMDSVIQSLSKAYFRKKATPSTRTMVPTQSSRRPPIAASRDACSSPGSGFGSGGGPPDRAAPATPGCASGPGGRRGYASPCIGDAAGAPGATKTSATVSAGAPVTALLAGVATATAEDGAAGAATAGEGASVRAVLVGDRT